MLKSMTAYGRASVESDFGSLVAEVKCVNRRFLDIDIVLPHGCLHFEDALRKRAAKYIVRGKVKVIVTANFTDFSPIKIKPNIALAKQLKAAYEEIAGELGYKKSDLSLSMLLREKDLLQQASVPLEDEKFLEQIQDLLNDALTQTVAMKEKEGAILQEDITSRLQNLKKDIVQIETESKGVFENYRKKLDKRVKELLPEELDSDDRILREVVLLADKADISEEITRFNSHIKQFEKFIENGNNVGKTLDFILQEMLREANTIGSKTTTSEVSHVVVEIKGELEKIREQIQNVE